MKKSNLLLIPTLIINMHCATFAVESELGKNTNFRTPIIVAGFVGDVCIASAIGGIPGFAYGYFAIFGGLWTWAIKG